MKRKRFLMACYGLTLTTSILAQPQESVADPISGTWTGDMAPKGATTRQPLALELKLDGTIVSGMVTGPPQPGEIKTGTFDPQSGALKFDVGVKGGGVFVFDGKVAGGTATGSVAGNNQTGDFKLSRRAAGSGESPASKHQGGDEAAAALRKSFGEVSAWVTHAADLVPPDKYTYRPAPGVRTFGQVIAHIADSYDYYCAAASGRNAKWSDAIEKGATDKATLVTRLGQSLTACNSAYGSAAQTGPLIENIEHTNLHYVNIVTYMRMIGVTPPSN